MAARHGSMIHNVVIVASKASGPELPNPPSLDILDPKITPAVPMAYVFPQAELDAGKLCWKRQRLLPNRLPYGTHACLSGFRVGSAPYQQRHAMNSSHADDRYLELRFWT